MPPASASRHGGTRPAVAGAVVLWLACVALGAALFAFDAEAVAVQPASAGLWLGPGMSRGAHRW